MVTKKVKEEEKKTENRDKLSVIWEKNLRNNKMRRDMKKNISEEETG